MTINTPFKAISACVLAMTCLGTARAGILAHEAYLPLAQAEKAADAALKKCAQDGYHVSVAVVDRAGVTKVLLHGDGAGPHTLNSSTRKAFTAASMGRSTAELANFIKDKPGLAGLRNMDDRLLILGGGLPIKIGDEQVGGIGVGGAPGGHLDEACAQAGIDSLTAR